MRSDEVAPEEPKRVVKAAPKVDPEEAEAKEAGITVEELRHVKAEQARMWG